VFGWRLKDLWKKILPSQGYLLIDIKKCRGCTSCMLACTLAYEGVENPTLFRIQKIQNSFESFPDDVAIKQCRQCIDPACVKACPVDALKSNSKYGNVRMIDKAGGGPDGKQACVDVCPLNAVKFTKEIPVQEGDSGYKVDLRGSNWQRLGYPTG